MYGASSAIVVSMLTPFALRVTSRIRCLKPFQSFRRDDALDLWTSAEAKSEDPPLLRSRHRTLCLIYLELELVCDESRDALHHPLTGPLAAHVNVAVSRPGESHPEALAELDVSLSTHTAPIMEPRRTPICQWANSSGARREMRAIQ